MQNLNSREYLRNIILSAFRGKKISKEQEEKLKQMMLSFNQEDWQNAKNLAKETVLEGLSQRVDKDEQIPEWFKDEVKKIYSAWINFCGELISEEFIMEAMACEKQQVPYEQRMVRLMPLLTKQMRVMASRKRTSVAPTHQAQNSFKKKWNELETMGMVFYSLTGHEDQKTVFKNVLTKARKAIALLKNLSPAEVKIFKEKGKQWIQYLMSDGSISYKMSQCPPAKDFFEAAIDLVDAVIDENLASEGIKICCEYLEIALSQLEQIDWKKVSEMTNEEGFQYGLQIAIKVIEEAKGLKSRILSLFSECANHCNRLAGAEVNQPISAAAEQSLIQKLSEVQDEHDNNDSETEPALGPISPVNLINNLGSNNYNSGTPPVNSSQISLSQAYGKLDSLMNEDSLGLKKWYHKWWGISLMVIGGAIISGVVVWLFLRSKSKDKKFEPREKRGYY